MKYDKKATQYFECFFIEVYEITMAQCDEKITAEYAIEKIHDLIAVIEDLTVETPIIDLEKTYVEARLEFEDAERTYVEREMDLDTMLTQYHKEFRK